jgi:hypothetical protein
MQGNTHTHLHSHYRPHTYVHVSVRGWVGCCTAIFHPSIIHISAACLAVGLVCRLRYSPHSHHTCMYYTEGCTCTYGTLNVRETWSSANTHDIHRKDITQSQTHPEALSPLTAPRDLHCSLAVSALVSLPPPQHSPPPTHLALLVTLTLTLHPLTGRRSWRRSGRTPAHCPIHHQPTSLPATQCAQLRTAWAGRRRAAYRTRSRNGRRPRPAQ